MLEGLLLVGLLVSGMLAVGTASDPADVRARLARPRSLLVAVALNALLVPALALVALRLVDAEPGLALGVLLCAAAPGGGTGALLAHHARGDASFAVVLQAVLAVVALATAPLWVGLAGDTVGLPVRDAVVVLVPALLLFQVLPVVVGSTLRVRRPGVADTVGSGSRRVADLLLLAVVVLLTVRNLDVLGDTPASSFALIAGVVGLTLLAGSASGEHGRAGSRAVLMTTGVRNLSLALLLAAGTDDGATATVLTYGLLMYVAVVALAVVLRIRDGRESCTTPA
ncbi:MAG: Na+-dependent transporter [Frankiales bacterium]|nr:Na+-dependent transporter [Frankiales bacterium]